MMLYHVLITGLCVSCCSSQTISGPLSVSLKPPGLFYYIWERSALSEIQCTASCSPNPCMFSWAKAGVEVSNTSLLTLGSMNKDKAGKYVCTASNTMSGATNVSGTVVIEVYYGPDLRQLTLNPSNLLYTLLEGQTLANITLSADCNPDCSFIWRKSGIMVSNTGVLSLGSVTRNHAGSYDCTVTNTHTGGYAYSLPVVIQIIYGPDSVTLSQSTLFYSITEGNYIYDITCSATCLPDKCMFLWTKSGTEVSNSSVLSLGYTQRHMAGNYVCNAKNPVSLYNISTGIIVVEIAYGPENITLSPVIKSYTLNEGQTLHNITCSAKCVPACTFLWKRSYTEIKNSNVMSVDYVKRGDTGIYECAVRNPKSGRTENSQSVELLIRYGPDSTSISPSSLYYSTTEGSTMSDITCSATCYPDKCSFSWTKSGTEVSNSSVLSLGSAHRNEAGNYVCTAKNPGTTDNASSAIIVVEIEYGPENITLSPVIKSYTLNEGQTLHNITCSAKCVPECTFSWTRSSTVILNSNVLSVGSVKRGDTGIYECAVRNPKSGQIVNSQSIELLIRFGPDSVSLSPPALHYQMTEGQVLDNITCSAQCVPDACLYTWSKSGTVIVNSFVLSLGSFEFGEAGSYICTAKNSGSGVTVSSHSVLIERKEPAKTSTEPEKTSTEPAKTSTEPAKTSTEPAKTPIEPETRQQIGIIVGGVMGGCVAIVLVVLLMLRRRYRLMCKCVRTESSPDAIDLHDAPSKTRQTNESEQHTQRSEIENNEHTYEKLAAHV